MKLSCCNHSRRFLRTSAFLLEAFIEGLLCTLGLGSLGRRIQDPMGSCAGLGGFGSMGLAGEAGKGLAGDEIVTFSAKSSLLGSWEQGP